LKVSWSRKIVESGQSKTALNKKVKRIPNLANSKYYRFQSLLQQSGWMSPAFVGVDERGTISYLSNVPPENVAVEAIDGFALPGFQNAHSHAFQYAMAGLAENHPAGTDDDFWTWREAMYRCALTMNPDQAEAVAAMIYAEMVRQGYTHVAEFHYLHHDQAGKPYTNLGEMGERMVAAAKAAGIKITLIPIFYQKGGFGLEPKQQQRRFISKTLSDYFKLLESSKSVVVKYENASLGFGVHSLRAVELKDVKETFHRGPKDLPFHLHVSEQKKEVEDCLAICGKRPVQWLLESLPLDKRFNLVHATHLDDHELRDLTSTKATVVLCPSTEGNLGDGIFRMKEYAQMKGQWTIGTDSHIGLNPFEELRMIDYRQRLITNKRNTFDGDAAQYMVNGSVLTGRKAMGVQSTGLFVAGQPFDAIVINATSHLFENLSDNNRLPSILYTSDSSKIIGTMVSGDWVVKNQHHRNGASIKNSFRKAMKELRIR
jgi:formimidoylglutamate deiminase